MKSWERLKAEDVMSAPVLALNVETTLQEASKTLGENRMSGALVTDHRGAPVGVVSLFDIVGHLAGLAAPPEGTGSFYRYSYPRFREGGEGWESEWEQVETEPLQETTVGEVMSTEIIDVPRDLPLKSVGKLLADRHIHRVFVAGEKGPIGVISTMDVLRAATGSKKARASA